MTKWLLIVHFAWPGYSGVSAVTVQDIATKHKCSQLAAQIETNREPGSSVISKKCLDYVQ